MVRKSPCHYCKQRRRKCEKTSESEPCKRCVQMKRKCISQDLAQLAGDSSEEEDKCTAELQDTIEMVSIYQQVLDLEKQIQTMEEEKQALVKKQSEPQWIIEYSDGQLQLKSQIKSIDELVLFGQSVIRYLSPFGDAFHSKTLRFEMINPSIIKEAMQTVAIHMIKYKKPLESSQYIQYNSIHFMQPREAIQRLVDRYFFCFNDTVPILHEPSYREHYSKLKDPLKDPITLAICASSAVSHCRHSFLSSQEKRYLGEYYYKLCMEYLIDMFDDPSQAIESLLVINLLQMFWFLTLRISESKKWASVALLLGNSLRNQNKSYSKDVAHLDRMTRINQATIHRNYTLSEFLMTMIDFIIYDKREDRNILTEKYDVLPDESQKIKEWIELTNHLIELCLNPAFILIVTQARHLALGDPVELSFEDILRYEETILEWWHNLPDHLKICQEPSNFNKEMIQSSYDVRKLMMACFMNVITLSVQGVFVQPKHKKDLEDIYMIIRNRAIMMAMHSADMCLYLTKQIESIDKFCYSPSKVLIRAIDSLLLLLQVPDNDMVEAAKAKLREYMYELSIGISEDHQVSPIGSPFTILSLAPPNTAPSMADLYKNYPIPGEAMIYDVLRTVVDRGTNS
ncbi:uncharacterized protein B0P05DRAFT_596186 [Gilbertella persicaria]|uniref:uncharacterized protein n=1 Tax=Gilbertella persicaria TaxID=101096 RepID=UPI00221F4723|nr:uncharacterized protein B0P05DRAFT_596186 [Gilbertella persicaria]KAI8081892.1 hypothetical protein B0P05DRAFT_596186 [Gilbertella persicaria]